MLDDYPNYRIRASEEHFVTDALVRHWRGLEHEWQDLSLGSALEGKLARELRDIGPSRLSEMNRSSVDVQVVSLTAPGVQNLEPDDAIAMQTASNDVLAELVQSEPNRFQGLAALATFKPQAAARELERAVTKLRLSGAMMFGRTRNRNFDDKANWPIFEAASVLHAPLYLHPQSPVPAIRTAYYTGFSDKVDAVFATHGIGWYYETGVQLLRLILGGVFDRFPDLQIIVGHWGEVVLFYVDKLDVFAPEAKLKRSFSAYLKQHVFVTPSGLFSQRYLRWTVEVMGTDRIMMSTDYPFVPVKDGGCRSFLEQADLSDADKLAIGTRNWNRLAAGIKR